MPIGAPPYFVWSQSGSAEIPTKTINKERLTTEGTEKKDWISLGVFCGTAFFQFFFSSFFVGLTISLDDTENEC